MQIKKYEQDEGDYALDSARGPAGGSNNKNSVWDFITKNTQRGFYEVTNSATSLAGFGTTERKTKQLGDSPEQARIGITGDGFASVGGGQVEEEEKGGVDAANNSVSQLIQLDKTAT